jgi:hypothetical protein
MEKLLLLGFQDLLMGVELYVGRGEEEKTEGEKMLYIGSQVALRA